MLVSVRGTSMTPSFTDGDRLLVLRRPPRRRGAVVVFDARVSGPTRTELAWLVKRVVAVPGDPVPVELAEIARGDAAVPAGLLLVRGDNPRSLDSRHFGYVPRRTVLGVVLVRVRAG